MIKVNKEGVHLFVCNLCKKELVYISQIQFEVIGRSILFCNECSDTILKVKNVLNKKTKKETKYV